MTTSGRIRLAVGVALGVALLALSGCGGATAGAADSTELSWDAQALQSIGFTTDELGSVDLATPAPSAEPGKQARRAAARHKLVRYAFGKNALHGEMVVQTEEGTKTVLVQRGSVTAVSATTMTVKSTDGYTLTWTFGSPVHVVKDRAAAGPSDLAVGMTVGVAGAKSGDTPTASYVVVPRTK